MYSDTELAKIWFYGLETVGEVTRKRLLSEFSSIENIFYAKAECLVEFVNKTQYTELKKEHNLDIMKEKINRLTEKNIRLLYYEEEEYPERLKNISDPPGILYIKGNFSEKVFCDKKYIAIVGSRNANAYGKELAGMFARELAKNNVGIISGLAMGVDGAAHRGALSSYGYTLGVLGCGIDVIYPRQNITLYSDMERHGGIISEHYLDVNPMPYHFPRRNRIISALSDGVLVVLAGEKSGSLITADFALEQGRQVYAIPGSLYDKSCAGTNNLIKQGAMCVTEPADILLDLFGTNALKQEKNDDIEKSLAPTEKMVYSCLSLKPTYIDDIVDKVKLSVTELISCLYGLEKKGVIKQTIRGYYIISI